MAGQFCQMESALKFRLEITIDINNVFLLIFSSSLLFLRLVCSSSPCGSRKCHIRVRCRWWSILCYQQFLGKYHCAGRSRPRGLFSSIHVYVKVLFTFCINVASFGPSGISCFLLNIDDSHFLFMLKFANHGTKVIVSTAN